MNSIQTIPQSPVTTLSAPARALFGASMSEATRRAYAGHCKRFQAWAEGQGLPSLPTGEGVLAEYIAALVEEGRKVSTIQQAIAAISAAHEAAGFPGLTKSPLVKRALAGARRTVGEAVTKKKAATAPLVFKMIGSIKGDSLKARRDRALLALGFAGAFRRSELVALEVGDIEEANGGALVTIRKSKTDQTGKGQVIGIPTGHMIEPLKLVRRWLEGAGITEGPIFQRMNRHGQLLGQMTPQGVALLIKDRAQAIGEDPALFAGHSLRAGFITSGVEAGADALAISEVSRHKNLDVLKGYVRRGNLLRRHAGASFL